MTKLWQTPKFKIKSSYEFIYTKAYNLDKRPSYGSTYQLIFVYYLMPNG
jgi:hypothetical protein